MTKKMNPEVKEKWLQALRSGKYKQTKERLTSNNRQGYCCLGVLCELYRQETGNGEWKTNPDYLQTAFQDHKYQFLGSDVTPPMEVIDWSGLPTDKWGTGDPEVEYNDQITNITYLNDEGKTFAELADIIESQL